MTLAGMGADVIKVEPPEGSSTRQFGPHHGGDDSSGTGSIYFWNYNRGKRSVVLDLESESGRDGLATLLATCDVLLESTSTGFLTRVGFGADRLRGQFPNLIVARISPFGDDGPWAGYKGSDLVHLALGGPVMNCGYDPQPSGRYDLPPIAAQSWHSYHLAGEQMTMAILAALVYRQSSGSGQRLSVAVHEAVSKSTELDITNWIMLRQPWYRQTCRHAWDSVGPVPTIVQTKDGRWFVVMVPSPAEKDRAIRFLEGYDMGGDGLAVGERPRTAQLNSTGGEILLQDRFQRFFRKFTYADAPWQELQKAGILCAPLRLPHENVADQHWRRRGTFSEVEHPELGRSLTYVTGKWVSSDTSWRAGRRAPLVGENTGEVLAALAARPPAGTQAVTSALGSAPSAPAAPAVAAGDSCRARQFSLAGVRIADFSWHLATAGGTRYLAALGAECIKIEWKGHPDNRSFAPAPIGGRAAREAATAPLQPVDDPEMGGQFQVHNAGKRGISLNVRHPKGLEIAKALIAVSEVVAEGFSPGTLDSWGLGYDALRQIRPGIIYVQQSGMGTAGTYGKSRTIGPIAQAMSGLSEMSGLPQPAMPAGWGYSYLDWFAAYSYACAIIAGLYHRGRTGEGQWIDASQVETGIYLTGTAVLDHSANGITYQRTGNRSPYIPAAPHGIYRCAGDDRWIAIACFAETEWASIAAVAGHEEWSDDPRFRTLQARLTNQDHLDTTIECWTRTQDPYALMARLQSHGVAAGVCQTAEDRYDHDPQLRHLNWLTEVHGTRIGTWPLPELPFHMEVTPPYSGGLTDRGAPCYGEDNEYVYGEILGLTQGEISNLVDEDII
jgi:crotonobetainyl-CoA:carnitine CoA-transferase CaiB-like acyl-CoA transferase